MYFKYYITFRQVLNEGNKRRAYFALAPDYGNLGDLAILEAQIKIIHTMFPEIEIIECPISETLVYIKSIKPIIKDRDIIILIGGGNISVQYSLIEQYRQLWIKMFPDNLILSFPQSCDLKNKDFVFGDKIKRVYSGHKKLILFARDENSYNVLRKLVLNETILVPDIVLSFGQLNYNRKRKGVLFCIRDDKESGINAEFVNEVYNYCEKKYCVEKKDTTISNISKIDRNARKALLEEIWECFSSKSLIITDRLHGMIFAYITNTPCIVFDNSNHKIKNFYNTWFRDNNRIVLVEKEINVYKQITYLLNDKKINDAYDCSYLKEQLVKYFNEEEKNGLN